MINTERLRLRMFEEEDAPAMAAVLAGEGVLDYFPPGPPPSLSVAEGMIRKILDHWDERGYGLWALELLSTGVFLGRAGLQYLPDTDEVEIDFILDRGFWGQGLATEAGRASLEFGFDQKGFVEVVGIVHPDNWASRRVLEKVGMRHDIRTEYFGMVVERYLARSPDLSTPG